MGIDECKKEIIKILNNADDKKISRIDLESIFIVDIDNKNRIKERLTVIKNSIAELKKEKLIKTEGKEKDGSQYIILKPWSYNKGEWSELYTFIYLLFYERMFSADKDLNVINNIYFPVLGIVREEDNNIFYYKTGYSTRGNNVKIYCNDRLVREISRVELCKMLKRLYKYIPEGEGRSFEIPGAKEFFNSICCTKVKAQSNQKEDITIKIKDIYTGIETIRGYSIKSYLGGDPTLLNAGENTNFTFILDGCTDEIMDHVNNNINTSTKNKDKIQYLLDSGCTFIPLKHSISKQFEENLQFIDTLMPDLVQLLVLYSYTKEVTDLDKVVEILMDINPFNYSNTNIYPYKIKKLLCAFALGLTGERKDWEGVEDANGGYITVKPDGKVVCYHLYDRTEFENYLYDYTKFERASTSKMKYLEVYKEDNQYRIKLNLQIRFKKTKRRN